MNDNKLYGYLPTKKISISGERFEQRQEVPIIKSTIKPYINIIPAQTDYIQPIIISFKYELIYDVWYSIDSGVFMLYETPFPMYSINDSVYINYILKTKDGVQILSTQTHSYYFKQLEFNDNTTNDKHLILVDNGQLILYAILEQDFVSLTYSNYIINDSILSKSYKLLLDNGILQYDDSISYSTLYQNSIILLNINGINYHQMTINNGIVQITDIPNPNTI